MTLEFTVDPELTEELGAEIIACWTDVTNVGGSVGFIPPVTMDDLLPATARALAGVAAGHDRLVIGREIPSSSEGSSTVGNEGDGNRSSAISVARGRLAALAFITDEQTPVTEHLRTVKRVMVHPDFQGRGYGALLMAEVERAARAMGLGLLALDCRAGTGNDEFYKKCGYVECGRLPGALHIGPDDYRDRVLMALSLRR